MSGDSEEGRGSEGTESIGAGSSAIVDDVAIDCANIKRPLGQGLMG